MVPIIAVLLDTVSSLHQINTALAPAMQLQTWQMLVPLFPLVWRGRDCIDISQITKLVTTTLVIYKLDLLSTK